MNSKLCVDIEHRSPLPTLDKMQLWTQFLSSPVPTYVWQWRDDDFHLRDFNAAAIQFTEGAINNDYDTTLNNYYNGCPDIIAIFQQVLTEKSSLTRELTVSCATDETKTLIARFSFIAPDLIVMYGEDYTKHRRFKAVNQRLAEENLLWSEWAEKLHHVRHYEQLLQLTQEMLRHQFSSPVSWLQILPYEAAEHTLLVTDIPHRGDHTGYPIIPMAEDFLVSDVLSQQQPISIANAHLDPRIDKILIPDLKDCSIVATALRFCGQPIGMVCVAYATQNTGNQSISCMPDILTRISVQLSAAVIRIQLLEKQRLTEAELLTARSHAERASNAKFDFLSRMSHELRTPMNAILGFAQLLEINRPNQLQNKYIQEILHAGNHLLEHINEILDLSRLEAGRLELQIAPLNISQLLSEALQLIEPIATKHKLRIIDDTHRHSGLMILADQIRTKQVILNLLANAVNHNRRAGSINIALDTGPANSITIVVTDTGHGLTPEQCVKIFDPFERLESPALRSEGNGIGLAIAHKLVVLMGGEIGVTSTPGDGSSFWFSLPRAEHAVSDAPWTATTSSAEIRQTILYVEDTPANLRLVESLLETRADTRFMSAPDGHLGLEIAFTQAPDVILLDINLPGMDGYEVLQRLQQHEVTRHTPVIAISADAMPKQIERGLKEGFYAYLTKPLDVKRFFQLLDVLKDQSTVPRYAGSRT